jgi:hypothetical protein
MLKNTFTIYVLTPIPSLLRKEGSARDKGSDMLIKLLPH